MSRLVPELVDHILEYLPIHSTAATPPRPHHALFFFATVAPPSKWSIGTAPLPPTVSNLAIGDNAANHSTLPILKLLHASHLAIFTPAAMDESAQAGRLPYCPVPARAPHRTEGCTTAAMDGAAKNGDLEMARFLHDFRDEGCTTAAMDAATWGWAFHVSEQRRGASLKGGEIVRFLHDDYPRCFTADAVDGACRGWSHVRLYKDRIASRKAVVSFPLDRNVGCSEETLTHACSQRNDELVRILLATRPEACSVPALEAAFATDNTEILRFFYAAGKRFTDEEAMEMLRRPSRFWQKEYRRARRRCGKPSSYDGVLKRDASEAEAFWREMHGM
ncbi:hypothetical protein BDK51DRAFT_38304 [Blyttiomyces helicus]|uniref:Ankyrin repeat-containing domain protein n=1 Tax=Blyttiomyces helicus TaxID=388810 RepID=A0A4P9W7F6_9FUNG|nr:hypothetical protein BDK51DRAFT_38304 [Blyttiomyces helicus]|eukprot:RKO86958.1 hypothetical protein BDK51DRAFT_38304 [Blyttiomyces helicus]